MQVNKVKLLIQFRKVLMMKTIPIQIRPIKSPVIDLICFLLAFLTEIYLKIFYKENELFS